MEKHVGIDPADTTRLLADWIINYISEVLKTQELFSWALSGGNSPRKLYELFSRSPYVKKIPWSRIHFFWGDERYVPFTDPQNNGRMAYEALLKHVPVHPDHIHFINTDLPPDQSASDYEKVLHQFFNETGKSFDLVLLGMGDNGHTLSLFPFDKIIHDSSGWVRSIYADEVKMYRITLMPGIVNRAACITFLVTGKNKAKTIHNVLDGPYDPDKFPAQLIKPGSGNLHWFLDMDAAGIDF